MVLLHHSTVDFCSDQRFLGRDRLGRSRQLGDSGGRWIRSRIFQKAF